MPSLQYLIDHMCANFTAGLMIELVTEQIAGGARTGADITQAIIARDPSLDVASAQTLIDAAVQTLVDAGEVLVSDGKLRLAGAEAAGAGAAGAGA